ncbi:MAG TPA: secretin N-terminal domain-containing protein, partial [Roseomonas sp.]
MRVLRILAASALSLAACGEPELRGTAAFDRAMQRLEEARQRPPDYVRPATENPSLALSTAAAPPAARRRTVVDIGSQARGPAQPGSPPGATPTGGGAVTLNFVEAGLVQVVQAVLGDLLGAGYTIDPRVSGSITLQTQRPVPQEAALSLLESALEANGAALLRNDGSYRVVPLEGALQAGPPVSLRAAGATPGPGFAIVALPLTYARAADLQKVLQPLSPRGGAVVADEARNILLLAGTGAQLSTLLETAQSFDVGWIQNQSLALLPLDSAPAASVAQEINSLFGEGSSGREALRVVPVARMNAVLVVAAQPRQLDRVRRWVRELDSAGLGSSPQLFVHRVQYVRASELAATLRQLLQGGGREAAAGGSLLAPGQAGVQAVGGSTLPLTEPPIGGAGAPYLQGGAQAGASPSSLIPPGGGPAIAGGPQLNGGAARVPGLSPGLAQGLPGGDIGGSSGNAGGAAGGLPAAPVRIVADEAQNALIVYASQTDWRLVERAVLLLDRPPSQVAIDAVIAEVTLNQGLEYGLSWFFRLGNFQFNQIQNSGGQVSQIFPGFNLLYSGGADAGAVLTAL